MSAHVQDAITHERHIKWLPTTQCFSVLLERFCWELTHGKQNLEKHRVLTLLQFKNVLRAQAKKPEDHLAHKPLQLLSLSYDCPRPPAGNILLLFAGGMNIKLAVEALDAYLTDTGEKRKAHRHPNHFAFSQQISA